MSGRSNASAVRARGGTSPNDGRGVGRCGISLARLRLLGLLSGTTLAPPFSQFFAMFGPVLADGFTELLRVRLPSRGLRGGQLLSVLLALEHLVCQYLLRICRLPPTRRFTSFLRIGCPPSPVRFPIFLRVGSSLLSRPLACLRSLAFLPLDSLLLLRHRWRGLRSRGRRAPPWCVHHSNLMLMISVYWPTGRTWMAAGARSASRCCSACSTDAGAGT